MTKPLFEYPGSAPAHSHDETQVEREPRERSGHGDLDTALECLERWIARLASCRDELEDRVVEVREAMSSLESRFHRLRQLEVQPSVSPRGPVAPRRRRRPRNRF